MQEKNREWVNTKNSQYSLTTSPFVTIFHSSPPFFNSLSINSWKNKLWTKWSRENNVLQIRLQWRKTSFSSIFAVKVFLKQLILQYACFKQIERYPTTWSGLLSTEGISSQLSGRCFFFFSFVPWMDVYQNIFWIYKVWKHPLRAAMTLLVGNRTRWHFLKDVIGTFPNPTASCIPKSSNL